MIDELLALESEPDVGATRLAAMLGRWAITVKNFAIAHVGGLFVGAMEEDEDEEDEEEGAKNTEIKADEASEEVFQIVKPEFKRYSKLADTAIERACELADNDLGTRWQLASQLRALAERSVFSMENSLMAKTLLDDAAGVLTGSAEGDFDVELPEGDKDAHRAEFDRQSLLGQLIVDRVQYADSQEEVSEFLDMGARVFKQLDERFKDNEFIPESLRAEAAQALEAVQQMREALQEDGE